MEELNLNNEHLDPQEESVTPNLTVPTEQETEKQPEVPTLKEEWNSWDSHLKQFCKLNENGELFLLAVENMPERKIGHLEAPDWKNQMEQWQKRFEDCQQQINDLNAEWETQEDKLKLESKVEKQMKCLMTESALGDFSPLLQNLKVKSDAIQQIYDANFQKRQEILNKAKAGMQEQDANFDFKSIKEEWKSAPEVRHSQYNELTTQLNELEENYYALKQKASEDRAHEEMQNLDLKLELCEKAERLKDSTDWRKTTDEMVKLFEQWKTIGLVTSIEKNQELWDRFNNARQHFFDQKREHSDKIRQEQENNYNLKLELVKKAEEIQNSTDWRPTTEAYELIMIEWKKIGRVPIEKSDELWDRLQAAKNVFFNAKRENAESFKKDLEENYQRKLALTEQMVKLKNSTDWHNATILVNQLMEEWRQIGHIPKSYGDDLWERFIGARKHFFKMKDEDRNNRRSRFKQQVQNRLQQTTQFLNKIETELEEAENDLKDYKQSLEQTGNETAIDRELRDNLEHLIKRLESSIPKKKAKIQEVMKQKEELEEKAKEIGNKNTKNKEGE